MTKEVITNARIRSVSLGIEDHDVLTAFLHLDFGGTSQGYGGYALDVPGANYAAAFIRGVLGIVGVREWAELPGEIIRVKHDDAPGSARRIIAIGNSIEDRWFDYAAEAAEAARRVK